MLKKFLKLRLLLLFLGLQVFCSPIFACERHPIILTFLVRTLNTNLRNLDQLRFGQRLQLQYTFTKHFYLKTFGTTFRNGKVTYGGRFGYTFTYDKFRPYVEAGFAGLPTRPNTTTNVIYLVGSFYDLSDCVTPLLEFDNPFIVHRAAVKVGSLFFIKKTFALRVDFLQRISRNGNRLDLGFVYRF